MNRHSGQAVHDAPGHRAALRAPRRRPVAALPAAARRPGSSPRTAGPGRRSARRSPAPSLSSTSAGRRPRRAAARPRAPAARPRAGRSGRLVVARVATGHPAPTSDACVRPAGHRAGSAAKSIISRPCSKLAPSVRAALQHRRQRDPPPDVADGHHQIGARPGQRDVAPLGQGQRQREPVPAVGPADLDPDRVSGAGQRIDAHGRTCPPPVPRALHANGFHRASAAPGGSAGPGTTPRPGSSPRVGPPAAGAGSRRRRRCGSTRLTVTASTRKPCSDSAVNSRRASAITIRSGVSTSRTPVIAGSASSARAAIRSASRSPSASRTVAFGARRAAR